MATVEAPKNKLVETLNGMLDFLIKGLGAEAAYGYAVTQFPFLGLPLISSIAKWIIGSFASSFDERLKLNVDIVVVRFQNEALLKQYQDAISKIKPGASAHDVQAAKDALDSLIHRAR